MGFVVGDGAIIHCAFGDAPIPLDVIPMTPVMVEGVPAATILDMIPLVNIATFGMCNTPSNPEVAAATAAALGALVPMPCVPVVVDPWLPGAPTVLANGMPLCTEESICMCAWGGLIEVVEPGNFSVLTE